jgi:hypothetical protein
MNDETMFSMEQIRDKLSTAIEERYLYAFNAEHNAERSHEGGEYDNENEWLQVNDSMHSEAEGIRVALVHLGVPLEQTFKIKEDAFDRAENRFYALMEEK